MVQNSPFLPTVLMQKEIEPVVDLKYIIMRILDNIICITALPWHHGFKLLAPFTLKMHVVRRILNLLASFQIRDFCILCPKLQDSGKSWWNALYKDWKLNRNGEEQRILCIYILLRLGDVTQLYNLFLQFNEDATHWIDHNSPYQIYLDYSSGRGSSPETCIVVSCTCTHRHTHTRHCQCQCVAGYSLHLVCCMSLTRWTASDTSCSFSPPLACTRPAVCGIGRRGG